VHRSRRFCVIAGGREDSCAEFSRLSRHLREDAMPKRRNLPDSSRRQFPEGRIYGLNALISRWVTSSTCRTRSSRGLPTSWGRS
jgi:hypothetical protein